MLLKIKTNANRGGYVDHVYVRHSLLHSAILSMVQFDGNYPETVPFPNADVFNPTIRNIFLDDVDTAPDMTPDRTTFRMSSAASRSPVANVYYRDSEFHTTSTLESGFSGNKNIANFVVENVTYVNPATGARTVYNTTPLSLADETTAVTAGGATVPLRASPDVITTVPEATLSLRGRLNLYPGFAGTVRVFVDRETTPVAAELAADGTFHTGQFTVDDDQYWYVDRHYIAVNFYDGINMNTVVYQIAVGPS